MKTVQAAFVGIFARHNMATAYENMCCLPYVSIHDYTYDYKLESVNSSLN
jgi:hypothetical protein